MKGGATSGHSAGADAQGRPAVLHTHRWLWGSLGRDRGTGSGHEPPVSPRAGETEASADGMGSRGEGHSQVQGRPPWLVWGERPPCLCHLESEV